MGYTKLNERPHVPPDPTPWQGVWHFPSWPKVDFFAWLLCHGRILTYDVLQRKGFHGPFICSMCKENVETTVHLILDCNFSKQIQFSFIHNLDHNFLLPCSTADVFSNWAIRLPGPPPKNQVIKTAWAILLKVICWQIWLERNRRIFRNTNQNHKALEIKIKCHIKECLTDIKDDSNLSQQDIVWGSFLGMNAENLITLRTSMSYCISLLRMRMQLKLEDFFLDKESIFSISDIFPHLKIQTNLFKSRQ